MLQASLIASTLSNCSDNASSTQHLCCKKLHRKKCPGLQQWQCHATSLGTQLAKCLASLQAFLLFALVLVDIGASRFQEEELAVKAERRARLVASCGA